MRGRKTMFAVYERLRNFLAPNLKYSQSIYEEVLVRHVAVGSRWLDLGCGHKLLPPWREYEEKALVSRGTVCGLDYDFKSLNKHRSIQRLVRGHISSLPFADNTFDIITSNMVFEHLSDPEAQLKEICRILKPGGTLIFHTPNVWGYSILLSRLVPESVKHWLIRLLEDRSEDDVFKTYYRINSKKAIEKAARSNGMKVEEIRMIVTDAQFAVIPPVAIFELIWLRLLMTHPMKVLRTNIIARLRKEEIQYHSARWKQGQMDNVADPGP